jgi:hypothetical protein
MLALTVPVSAADVSGVWNMSLKADWTSIPALVCKLSQSGRQLTGSCRADGDSSGDEVTLTGGTVEDNHVRCQWRVVTPDGQMWTYALTGALDAKETMIEGSFTLSNAQSKGAGSFTAKKQQ